MKRLNLLWIIAIVSLISLTSANAIVLNLTQDYGIFDCYTQAGDANCVSDNLLVTYQVASYRTWLQFNIKNATALGLTSNDIQEAYVSLKVTTSNAGDNYIFEVNTSINESMTDATTPCGATRPLVASSYCNGTYSDVQATGSGGNFMNWNITGIVKKHVSGGNITLLITSPEIAGSNQNTNWNAREGDAGNRPLVTIYYTAPVTPVSSPNLTIIAKDYFDGSAITNFTAIIYGQGKNFFQTTTNGTILIINITENQYYNLTINSTENGGYFTRIYQNVNISQQTLTAKLWQSILYVNASDLASTQIISFGIRVNGSQIVNLSNSTGWATLFLKRGDYNLTGNSTPYLNHTDATFSISALQEKFWNTTFASNRLTVNATELISGLKVNGFEIRLTRNESIYSDNKSTTNGIVQFEIPGGNFSLIFVSTNYSTQTIALNINSLNMLPNYTFNVYKLNSVNFSIFDEIIGKVQGFNQTASVPVTLNLVSGLSSQNFTTSNSTFYVDMIAPLEYRLSYSATKYRQRQYYFTLLNSTFSSIDLYLLSITNGTLVTFTVRDQFNNPSTNITLIAQRYYVSSNSYITIAMARTDAQGQAIIDLEFYNAFYKFLVLDTDGTILEETIPTTVFSTTYPFRINNEGTSFGDIQYRDGISSILSFSNVTNTFSLSYNDPSSYADNTCLLVKEVDPKSGITEVCNTCSTSTSSTLLCGASSSINANKTVIAQAFSYTQSGVNQTAILLNQKTIASEFLSQTTRQIMGDLGVLVAFSLTTTMIMVGLFNPLVAMVFGVIGFITSFYMGFISLGVGGTGIIIGIVILTGIIMYRSRA